MNEARFRRLVGVGGEAAVEEVLDADGADVLDKDAPFVVAAFQSTSCILPLLNTGALLGTAPKMARGRRTLRSRTKA